MMHRTLRGRWVVILMLCTWGLFGPGGSGSTSAQTTSGAPSPEIRHENPTTGTPPSGLGSALESRATTPVIVIDPGHPSEVAAADNVQNGTTEVKINWEVALKLEQLISRDSSLRCRKTKDALGERVTNRRRAEIANETQALLMVRLHCDSGRGSGCTLYYPDRQGTAQGVTGPSADVISGSRAVAQALQEGLSRALQSRLPLNPIKGDSATAIGSKQGALTGSIFSQVPTVTVEMVYLNNRADAEFIKSAEGQDLIAKGLYDGIKTYANMLKRSSFIR